MLFTNLYMPEFNRNIANVFIIKLNIIIMFLHLLGVYKINIVCMCVYIIMKIIILYWFLFEIMNDYLYIYISGVIPSFACRSYSQ